MTVPVIKNVGVVGLGVIGLSWTTLFLSRGLRVLVADPDPAARKKLRSYLEREWPTLKENGLRKGASMDNYEFVESIDGNLGSLDFLQEVRPSAFCGNYHDHDTR